LEKENREKKTGDHCPETKNPSDEGQTSQLKKQERIELAHVFATWKLNGEEFSKK